MYPFCPDDGKFGTQQILQLYAHAGTFRRDDAGNGSFYDHQMVIAACGNR